MNRTCSDCPAPISRKSKGRCRPCSARYMNTNTEIIAKRAVSVAIALARPEVKAASAARLRRYLDNMPEEHRERRREHGRRQYANVLSRPDVLEKSSSQDARARAGRAHTDRRLGWCPPERRVEYRDLIYKHHMRAAEAREMIEAEIPGTRAHAKRLIRNTIDAQRIRAEREKAQAY